MEKNFGDILTMENKEFKKIIDKLAREIHFEPISNGWIKESNECILMLNLQKSSFSNSYYLNISIFIQGAFGRYHSKSKELIKSSGDIFRRQPKEYEAIFDLEVPIEDSERKLKLEELFHNFITVLADKSSTRNGIKELGENGYIFINPVLKIELC